MYCDPVQLLMVKIAILTICRPLAPAPSLSIHRVYLASLFTRIAYVNPGVPSGEDEARDAVLDNTELGSPFLTTVSC
jgi:hypothetical protein